MWECPPPPASCALPAGWVWPPVMNSAAGPGEKVRIWNAVLYGCTGSGGWQMITAVRFVGGLYDACYDIGFWE